MTPDQTALEQAAQQAKDAHRNVDLVIGRDPYDGQQDDIVKANILYVEALSDLRALVNDETILALLADLRQAQKEIESPEGEKEGESPFERLVRERQDNDTLLGELAKAKRRAVQAEADLRQAQAARDEALAREADIDRFHEECEGENVALRAALAQAQAALNGPVSDRLLLNEIRAALLRRWG